MKKIVYVLHERSTKEHFIALENYANKRNIEVKYREFLIFRYIIKSLVKLDFKLFIQQLKNIVFFATSPFSSQKNIIIGIAPIDFHLPFLLYFLRRHNLFYFTSWGDWKGGFFPKTKYNNFKFIKKSWVRFLEKEVKGIFSVTNSSSDSIKENYNISCPIIVVHHSIDNTISFNNELITQRNPNKVTMIFVGRLVESKGIYEMFNLMKCLDKSKYSLKIIGDGPLRSLVKKAEEQHENIKYYGYLDSKKELFKLYLQSDIQLLFSKKVEGNKWEELFGMVIIEAMYCGVPTISTKHIGPKSIIDDGVNGFLIDEERIIEQSIDILKKEIFKKKDFILETQKSSKAFYKDNLAKKWGVLLNKYI